MLGLKGDYQLWRIKTNPDSEDWRYITGLTKKGVEFYFDIEDFDKVKMHAWYLSKRPFRCVVEFYE